MKMLVVRSLKQFYEKMAAYVPTALTKNHTVCPAQVYEKELTNAAGASAILPLQPKRPCTVPSCRLGLDCPIWLVGVVE